MNSKNETEIFAFAVLVLWLIVYALGRNPSLFDKLFHFLAVLP